MRRKLVFVLSLWLVVSQVKEDAYVEAVEQCPLIADRVSRLTFGCHLPTTGALLPVSCKGDTILETSLDLLYLIKVSRWEGERRVGGKLLMGSSSSFLLLLDEGLCGGLNVLNVNKLSMARGFIRDSLIEVFISSNLVKPLKHLLFEVFKMF